MLMWRPKRDVKTTSWIDEDLFVCVIEQPTDSLVLNKLMRPDTTKSSL